MGYTRGTFWEIDLMQATIQPAIPPTEVAPVALTNLSILTLEEVSEYLRLPIEAVRDHAVQGLLPGNQIQGEWRFLKSAIDQWLSPTVPLIVQDFKTAQSDNDAILALIASWDTPDQEEHQTQTWNMLKVALQNSEGLRSRDAH
jgi:hypothetical protein